jgi:hypothetical protein
MGMLSFSFLIIKNGCKGYFAFSERLSAFAEKALKKNCNKVVRD